MVLAQAALTLAHMRQPEIIHVLAGAGADGKSMIMVDLLKATFGSGFGNPSCTLLQDSLMKHLELPYMRNNLCIKGNARVGD